MTFHEKLLRLTEDRKRTVICKRAGLPANAITNYLSKRQMPGANVAFRLARVLGVDLSWLLNDQCGWPPVRVEEAHDKKMPAA